MLNVAFFKSTDGGKTFPSNLRPPHGDNHDLWIAPNDNKRMIEANDGGANVVGERRRDLDRPGFSDRAALPHHRHEPQAVLGVRRTAGQQHGVRAQPRLAADGADWLQSAAAKAATSPAIRENPNIFYAGNYGGFLTRFDYATGNEPDR